MTEEKYKNSADHKVADLLLKKGYINQDSLKGLIEKQKMLTFEGNTPTLAQVAVDEGIVSKGQLQSYFKKNRDLPIELGGFKIIKKIGSGGTGTIYQAKQISMNRDVALKLLEGPQAENPTFIKRFYHEAHAAARLNHPNIVTAIDVGSDKDQHYFAMELVEGISLKNLMLTKGALSEKYCLHIAKEIVQGLEHAATHNIIHRDIKPDNILLSQRHSVDSSAFGTMEDVVRIVDLGIAKFETEQENQAMLNQEATPIDPHYLSPEQAMGEKNIDFRTDIYSLGATLYHMTTGTTPQNLEEPRKINPNISPSVNKLILKMMHKDRNKRFDSYQALLKAIKQAETKMEKKAIMMPSIDKAKKALHHLIIWSPLLLLVLILLWFFNRN